MHYTRTANLNYCLRCDTTSDGQAAISSETGTPPERRSAILAGPLSDAFGWIKPLLGPAANLTGKLCPGRRSALSAN